MEPYYWESNIEPFLEEVTESNQLLVLTFGLGGNYPSYYLYNYLKDHGKEYAETSIYAFGKDAYSSTNRRTHTYYLLGGIEGLSVNSNAYGYDKYPTNDVMRKEFRGTLYNHPVGARQVSKDLPIITRDIGSDNNETIQSYMDLQLKDTTYKYYVGKTFVYQYGLTKENEKFLIAFDTLLRDFLEKSPNGQILIDHNAFIRGSTYKNLNFEHMPWLPQMLSALEQDDRIFLLRKSSLPSGGAGQLHLAEKVPFFSKDAVFRPLTIVAELDVMIPTHLRRSFEQKIDRLRHTDPHQVHPYSLEIYKCLKDGFVFTEIPEPGHVACAAPAAANAAVPAAAAANAAAANAAVPAAAAANAAAAAPAAARGGAGTAGGGRKIRKTRKNRSSRKTRRSQRRKH